MKLNVISRIAADKDFFNLYLEAISLLKKKHNCVCTLNFIGPVESVMVYDNIVLKSNDLEIGSEITFTKKSLKYNEMPNDLEDYYLNVSIGNFVGYSSIECIEHGFKTIFINIDSIKKINKTYLSFCNNINDFYNLLEQIFYNSIYISKIIKTENNKILDSFYLNNRESHNLKNILSGK